MSLPKDLVSGAIFLVIAVAFGITAAGYDTGTLTRVGPGLFPLTLCTILAVLGVAIIVSGLRKEAKTLKDIPWRAVILVVASPLVFVTCIEIGLGLVPAAALLAFVGSFASATMTWHRALLSALGLGVVTWVIFILGLGIAVPAFGPSL